MTLPTRAAFHILTVIAAAGPLTAQSDGWRTISFETTQVTAPDVAVSPDGQFLIFTMLGKLFRIPVKGGEAEQLTFGPHYDVEPAISPDGKLVAFHSDRDGTAGNIFLLNLASREITQLTREMWADRPAWTPDGQAVVYLQLERSAWNPVDSSGRPPAIIRRQRVAGGAPETLRSIAKAFSVFHLPDGRPAWNIVTRDSASRRVTTRVEALNADGSVAVVREFDGPADPIVPSPTGDGLYVRNARWDPYVSWQILVLDPDLWFVPSSESPPRRIASLSEWQRFAVASDGRALYGGSLGRLWKVTLPNGRREAIPMHARVTLEIREPTPAPRWTSVEPGAIGSVRTILEPRLSPDGSLLAFRAFNRLWKQPVAGTAPAERVVADTAGVERAHAFSPDGRELAFVRSVAGTSEIRVLTIRTGASRTVAPNARCYESLVWQVPAELIAAEPCGHDSVHTVVAIDVVTGTSRVIAKTSFWEPQPQSSGDGRTIYFQSQLPDGAPGLFRLSRNPKAEQELLFRLPQWADQNLLPMHGDWIALPIPNRPGLRLARFRPGSTSPTMVRDIEGVEGTEMAFTPDGAALLYVAGARLWREPLAGGARKEIPIRLSFQVPTPAPVLLQRVKVLDFAAGGFGPETSLLLEGGRIRWIGSADGRTLPAGTETMDAGGRFAIPGLFEMHGHGNGCGGPARIAHGVTSVRNMGGRPGGGGWQNTLADRGDFTSRPIPRCFYSGRILEGPNGASRNEDWFFVHVIDELDVRTQIQAWKGLGVHFIKLYNWVPWPLQKAAADQARQLGLPVVAHGNNVEQATKAVTLGYSGLTHWGIPTFHEDAVRMFAAAGTRWEPTLGISGCYALHFRNDPERFRRASRGDERLSDNFLRGWCAEVLRTIGAAYSQGVTFLPGTDSGPEGLALLWELEFYAEAGIPPLDILRFATKSAAETVGAGADLGGLEIGKLADLVLLDANPLEDIKNTQKIWRVFKGGWQFDPRVLLPGGN